MSYKFQQSPNRSSRKGLAVSSIVLHFTASATLLGTVNWFQKPHARVSAHYVVGRNGQIVQMVHENEKAWHAGKAKLSGDPRVNSMSIGIEIVNWGELQYDGALNTFYCWPGNYTRKYDPKKYGQPIQSPDGKWWAPYTDAQVDAVVSLCRDLVQRYPAITEDRLVGHSDVAPGRKTDPGPALDMDEVLSRVFESDEPESVLLPDSAYLEDEPSEEELAKRQNDRTEPLSWFERVIARLNGFRG
jgi:N-acetyl-anhydromuramyl-L-alanine amidase AmpD